MIQHASLDGSIANENPPLGEGQTARLKFVRRVETMDKYYHNYASSVSRCLDEYAKKRRFLYESLKDQPPALRHGIHCPDAKELEILERHARGEYSGRRAVINH